jgi:hypothetical protein
VENNKVQKKSGTAAAAARWVRKERKKETFSKEAPGEAAL